MPSAPSLPAGPSLPCTPWSPVTPSLPCTPWSPVSPSLPCGPCGPSGPAAPRVKSYRACRVDGPKAPASIPVSTMLPNASPRTSGCEHEVCIRRLWGGSSPSGGAMVNGRSLGHLLPALVNVTDSPGLTEPGVTSHGALLVPSAAVRIASAMESVRSPTQMAPTWVLTPEQSAGWYKNVNELGLATHSVAGSSTHIAKR